MPEEIVQVAFQDGVSGTSYGAVAPAMDSRNMHNAGVSNLFATDSQGPNSSGPDFPGPAGLSGPETWENFEARMDQGNATRLATRPAPVSAPYTASPTAGYFRMETPATTASPDLSKPWDLGEFDSDGARIVSAEEAARLGLAGTSPNRSSNSSAARSSGRGGSRTGSTSPRQTPATGTAAATSQQKDSVVQGESLVERLAMRSRQNRTTTSETVSRGASMNTAASQPVGGPGLGAALRDAMPGGSLGKSLAGEFRASNDRTWSANHAVMPVAEFRDNSVTVRNIRYTFYRTAQDYTARYYDATFNLDEIRSIDVIVAPFTGTPSLAHVEASFGFADGTYIAVSIEGRYEQGESYDPLGGITNQFELIYIVADERDVIRLYTQVNKNEIYLYRLRMTPAEVREIFVSMLNRANKLTQTPEFYHAVSNNCATNLIAHINAGRTNAIPRDYRARFPGLIDRLLFERGLLETTETDFKKVREGSQINWLAEKFGDMDEFSLGIRQQLH